MSEWQDIETAPKDGSLIDLKVDGKTRRKCKWINGCWAQFFVNRKKRNDEVNLFRHDVATNWRTHVS